MPCYVMLLLQEFLFVTTESFLQLQIYNRTSGVLIQATDLDAFVYDIVVVKELDTTSHGELGFW